MIAHDFAGDFLVAAPAAEDLSADSTVMSPPERVEFIPAFVAFLTVTIRHPILLKVTVFVDLGPCNTTIKMMMIIIIIMIIKMIMIIMILI